MKVSKNNLNNVPIDFILAQSGTSKQHKFIKCSIIKSEIIEQTDLFIFRNRVLRMTIITRFTNIDKKWTVRR